MALSLVKKFRDLAEVEANRPVIVRDQGCLPLLLSHISSSDSDIVIVALEGIHFLSMCPENRPLMRNERGLLSLVQMLRTHTRPEISELARSIVSHLDVSNQENVTPKSNTPNNSRTPLSNCSNASTPSSTGGSKRPSVGKRARTVTLYLPELSNEAQRKVISEALLNIKGVISFLIDMYAQKVVVRTSTGAEALAAELEAAACMEVSLKARAVPAQTKAPEYLQDSDDEENFPHAYGALTKKRMPGDEEEQANAWGGWGFGRIAKALWG